MNGLAEVVKGTHGGLTLAKKKRKRKLSSIASNMTSLTSTNKQTFLLVLLSASVTVYNVGIWFIDTIGTYITGQFLHLDVPLILTQLLQGLD